jgi:hypothetical protein
MYRSGALKNLLNAVQDHRCADEVERSHQSGTGLAVNTSVRHVVIDFRVTDERMYVLRLKAKIL